MPRGVYQRAPRPMQGPANLNMQAIAPAPAPSEGPKYHNMSLVNPEDDDGDLAARPGSLALPPGMAARPPMATIYGKRVVKA